MGRWAQYRRADYLGFFDGISAQKARGSDDFRASFCMFMTISLEVTPQERHI